MLKFESHVSPGASRCIVNQEGGALEIIIPVQRTHFHWFMMIFPFVWMAGWLSFHTDGTVGPNDPPLPPLWLLVFPMLPLFVIGLFGIAGAEVLRLEEGRGTLSFKLFGFTVNTKKFPAASLSGLRKTNPENYDCQFALSHIVGGGRQPTLIFTHGYWEICFGSGMDPAEAGEILARIQEHLRGAPKGGGANG